MNLPNKLTIARCLMAALFVAVMSVPNLYCYIIAYALFCAASLTDYYDGKIARERGLITNFGKLFDPVADKVLMLAAYIMLMGVPGLRIPEWCIVAIFAREFLVMGARALAASDGLVIAANQYGKIKTTLQIIYVLIFLFLTMALELFKTCQSLAGALPGGLALYESCIGHASRAAIIIVAIYTVYSGIQFARINWHNLNMNQLS